MSNHTTPHPIWQRLREEGRYNLVWLAERTGFSHSHVKGVAAGIQNAGPRFRAACAELLGVDESVLFHGTPEAPSGRARTAVQAERTDAPQEVAIGIAS